MSVMLWCGAAGAVLFILVFLLDGLTRPGYRPLRHPVSALALGPRGSLQTANFVVCGAAILVGALALPAAFGGAWLAAAVVLFAVALIASGVFPMDAMRGYPPGTPEGTPKELSLTHKLHDGVGAVVFVLLPLMPLIAAFTLHGWAWRWGSGLLALALAVGVGAFSRAWEGDSALTGLAQRVPLSAGLVWLAGVFSYGAAFN